MTQKNDKVNNRRFWFELIGVTIINILLFFLGVGTVAERIIISLLSLIYWRT